MKKFNKTHALTMADRLSRSYILGSKLAFTMAEILISLTIIGVIAAITLPALRANINESTWNTQRKALYSRMSQAISMMPALNGYGIGSTDAETNSKAAMAFVSEGLDKVLKINNICDSTELSKCGIPDKITAMPNSKMNFPTNMVELNPVFSYNGNPQKNINTNAVAFETANGESIAVFYNPLCKAASESNYAGFQEFTQPLMCANFIYDLNGRKGPNRVGKDIGFITALYPTEPNVIAPMPLTTNALNGTATSMAQTDAAAACRKQDENSRVPNRDELTAMFYNQQLLGIASGNFWSGSVVSSEYAWYQTFNGGYRGVLRRSGTYYVRCVKR